MELEQMEKCRHSLSHVLAKAVCELFDGVNAIDWKAILPVDCQFPVKGSSLSSTLSSVPACQSIV